MAGTTAFVGEPLISGADRDNLKQQIYQSILAVSAWLERNDYRAYDPFDGLNAKLLRPLTFENDLLRTVLQQGLRRFPLNLRHLVGVPKGPSSKGMGLLARGFIRLHQATSDNAWRDKSEMALEWLMQHKSLGYSGACWGNHFDYQCRSFYLPKDAPTVVWTALIGHAFLDAYEYFQKDSFLQVAVSSCEHILRDLETFVDGDALCIGYIPGRITAKNKQVHNSSTLGASLLARRRTCTGSTTFTPPMCSTASNITRKALTICNFTRTLQRDTNTGRTHFSWQMESQNTMTTKFCQSTSSAARRRLTRLFSSPTGIQKACPWR